MCQWIIVKKSAARQKPEVGKSEWTRRANGSSSKNLLQAGGDQVAFHGVAVCQWIIVKKSAASHKSAPRVGTTPRVPMDHRQKICCKPGAGAGVGVEHCVPMDHRQKICCKPPRRSSSLSSPSSCQWIIVKKSAARAASPSRSPGRRTLLLYRKTHAGSQVADPLFLRKVRPVLGPDRKA